MLLTQDRHSVQMKIVLICDWVSVMMMWKQLADRLKQGMHECVKPIPTKYDRNSVGKRPAEVSIVEPSGIANGLQNRPFSHEG